MTHEILALVCAFGGILGVGCTMGILAERRAWVTRRREAERRSAKIWSLPQHINCRCVLAPRVQE